MENEKLVKELRSFPQEVQPNMENQRKAYEAIMKFYDDFEGKKENGSGFNWRVWAAGVAALILAGFFILPNLLSHHEENQLGGPQSVSEKLYSSEWKNVQGIMLSNEKGLRIKTVKDQSELNKITGILGNASYFSKGNQQLENSMQGPFYLIELQMANHELISFQYWPNEQNPNLLDLQKRNWWTVKELDQIVSNIQSTFIPFEDVISIAKEAHPEATWDYDANAVILVDKGDQPTAADMVYLARGLTPSQELLTIYIDAVTGEVIGEEQPETTGAGVNAAEKFFDFVGSGNLDAAWNLIHSRSKNPNPQAKEQDIRTSFDAYFRNRHEKINKIVYAKWTPFLKLADCQCHIEKAIEVKVILDTGKSIIIHPMKDTDGTWKMFWNSDGELE